MCLRFGHCPGSVSRGHRGTGGSGPSGRGAPLLALYPPGSIRPHRYWSPDVSEKTNVPVDTGREPQPGPARCYLCFLEGRAASAGLLASHGIFRRAPPSAAGFFSSSPLTHKHRARRPSCGEAVTRAGQTSAAAVHSCPQAQRLAVCGWLSPTPQVDVPILSAARLCRRDGRCFLWVRRRPPGPEWWFVGVHRLRKAWARRVWADRTSGGEGHVFPLTRGRPWAGR